MKIYTISLDERHNTLLLALQKRWLEANRSRTFARALEIADAGTAPLAITADGKMVDVVTPAQPEKRGQKRREACPRSQSSTTKRRK